MNDLALAILCVSAAVAGYGICLMALWTWRGISAWVVTTWSALLDGCAIEIK